MRGHYFFIEFWKLGNRQKIFIFIQHWLFKMILVYHRQFEYFFNLYAIV